MKKRGCLCLTIYVTVRTSLLFLIGLGLGLNFSTQEAKAQEICQIYITTEVIDTSWLAPYRGETDLQVIHLEQNLHQLSNETLASLLTDNTFLLGERRRLHFSLLNGRYNETWVPLTWAANQVPPPREGQSFCQSLRSFLQWARRGREAALALVDYRLDAASDSFLGETLIKQEATFLWQQQLLPEEVESAQQIYRELLAKIPQNPGPPGYFFRFWTQVVELIYSREKENINYCKDKAMMIYALLDRCTNCVGETALFIALFIDAGFEPPAGWKLGVQIYKDHVMPVLYHEENSRAFDLSVGRFVDFEAILSYQDYLFTYIRGFNKFVHPMEKSLLGQHQMQKLGPRWGCWPARDGGYISGHQVNNLSRLGPCDNFREGSEPPGFADNHGRWLPSASSGALTFSDTDAGSGEGLTRALEFLASPLLGVYNYLRPGSNQGRASSGSGNYGGNSGLNSAASRNIFDNYKRLLAENKLSRQDADFVSMWLREGEPFAPFADYFSRQQILEFMETDSQSSEPRRNALSYITDIDESCLILPAIRVTKKEDTVTPSTPLWRAEIDIEFVSVHDAVIKGDELAQKYLEMNMNERYMSLLSYFETQIFDGLQKINQIPPQLSRGSLEKQILFKKEIVQVFDNFKSYVALVGRIRNSCWLLNYSSWPLLGYKGYIIEELREGNFGQFWRAMKSNPLQLLQVLDELSDLEKRELSELWKILFQGSIALEGGFLVLERNFIQDALTNFKYFVLHHPDYFFTATSSEQERQMFGGVRPVQPILVRELRAREQVEPNRPDVQLPQIEYTCRPEDEGRVVQVGFLYVDCSQSFAISSETKLSDEFSEGGDHDKNQEGQGNKDQIGDLALEAASIQGRIPHLPYHMEVDKVHYFGSPEGDLELQQLQNGSDPRQEVILQVSTWKLFFSLFQPFLYGDSDRLAVHHLYRESLKDIIEARYRWVSSSRFQIDYYQIFDFELHTVAQEVVANRLSRYEGVISLERMARLRHDHEKQTQIPTEYNDNHFRAARYYHAKNNLHPDWSASPRFDEYREFINNYGVAPYRFQNLDYYVWEEVSGFKTYEVRDSSVQWVATQEPFLYSYILPITGERLFRELIDMDLKVRLNEYLN